MQYVKIVILSFFILFGISSNAQFVGDVQNSYEQSADSLGEVNIIQDARILELLDTDKMINSKDPGFLGYRIQIFSGRSTDREKAFEIKKEFNELFPEERAYVVYKAPDFRVSVGDFRSKIESIELKKACLKFFPNCYPVKTYILFSDLIPNQQEVDEGILDEENK
ncbi:MAG: hypothetical protein COC06_03380 [Bacteroidales bacterium]|nr:MAG: hypothetical protein COC06_03380 [Bacteroidales bacterium]